MPATVRHRAHAEDALLHAATDIGMAVNLIKRQHQDPLAVERQLAQLADFTEKARRQLERAEAHLRLAQRVPTLFSD